MSEPKVFTTTVASLPFSYTVRIDPAGHAVFDLFRDVNGASEQVGTFKADPTEYLQSYAAESLKGCRVIDVTREDSITGTVLGPTLWEDEPVEGCWVDVLWHTEDGDDSDDAEVKNLRLVNG
ncbi:hypothetical protein ACFV0H_06920 [Streptomyces erythrochromogenes]|uniref:hypothetical protein n=1 Tax=Streptomyces erythrochromogenes TaxID=285574 RepID=UPI0036ADFF07